MILYHGTTLEIRKPMILRNEIGRDFGYAFNTTDIREQAERWALRRARLQGRRQRTQVSAIVNEYEYFPNAQLLAHRFQGASLEWLDMVLQCRSHSDFVHGFDIVEGKIANDNVGETVTYVLQGIMRKEDAIERLRFEKINNQIAFCTERALQTLRFRKSYVVEEG